jgi:hypothetical protein
MDSIRCLQALFRGEDTEEAQAGALMIARFLQQWSPHG